MKKFCVFLLSLLLMALMTGASLAATNASGVLNRKISANPAYLTDGFSTVLYDNTNGMPTAEANAIAETSEGFIWIGLYSGLIRYDGNSFVRLSSTTGIASVVSLYVDKKDRLWIGTNDLGIAVMEKGQIKKWNHNDGMKSLQIIEIAEDDDGIIYAATATGIVMIDGDMKLSYIDDPRIIDAPIENIRAGSDGMIYGVTSGSDIFTVKDGKLLNYLSHEETGLRGIEYLLPDPERTGLVYLGMENSIFYGSITNNKLKNLLSWNISPLSSIDCLEYIDGQLWICSRNGIGVLTNGELKTFQDFPMNNSVCGMMTDYEGNLWFASDRQGLMKIVPNQFSNLFERHKLPHAMVNATCLYKDQLFMGTDTGLTVIDGNGVVPKIPLNRRLLI